MLLASIWLFPLIRWYSYSVGRPLASADLRFFSLLHFRQYLSSDLHFRQFNGSKTRIVHKVEMRNLSVLIELAAKNWFKFKSYFSPFVASSNLNPVHTMTGSEIQHLQLLCRP